MRRPLATPIMSRDSRQSSFIWAYFKVNFKDLSKVNCKICKACISRGRKHSRSYNTSNLVQHLRCKHIVEYGLFQADKREKEVAAEQTTSAASHHVLTLDAMLDSKQPFAFSDPRAISWHKAIVEVMALDVTTIFHCGRRWISTSSGQGRTML